jgi:hypothetical protein
MSETATKTALENLGRDDFVPNLNTRFRLLQEDQPSIELLLVNVSELATRERQQVFSIEFQGPVDLLLPQQMYRLDHDVLGAFELMIVPIRQDAKGIYYEAVFNRLI